MNGIRWLNGAVNARVIYEHLVDTRIHCAYNIHFDTIPDHDAFVRLCIGLHKCIVENFFLWFQATRYLPL